MKQGANKRWMLMLVLVFVIPNLSLARDLNASLAFLPKISESPDKGAFVDLVKAFDELYTEGTIQIKVYPFPRSIDNVIQGAADFHIPLIKNPIIPEEKLPYRYCSEATGKVVLVIYSHKDKPITIDQIKQAQSQKPFPYKMEVGSGLNGYFDFPIAISSGLDQSLKKVDAKRIDAFIWAQEEGDFLVKELKLKGIYRSNYGEFDDIIIIPKGPKGDEIDQILSDIIKKLRSSGRLEELHSKIHIPYDDWQP